MKDDKRCLFTVSGGQDSILSLICFNAVVHPGGGNTLYCVRNKGTTQRTNKLHGVYRYSVSYSVPIRSTTDKGLRNLAQGSKSTNFVNRMYTSLRRFVCAYGEIPSLHNFNTYDGAKINTHHGCFHYDHLWNSHKCEMTQSINEKHLNVLRDISLNCIYNTHMMKERQSIMSFNPLFHPLVNKDMHTVLRFMRKRVLRNTQRKNCTQPFSVRKTSALLKLPFYQGVSQNYLYKYTLSQGKQTKLRSQVSWCKASFEAQRYAANHLRFYGSFGKEKKQKIIGYDGKTIYVLKYSLMPLVHKDCTTSRLGVTGYVYACTRSTLHYSYRKRNTSFEINEDKSRVSRYFLSSQLTLKHNFGTLVLSHTASDRNENTLMNMCTNAIPWFLSGFMKSAVLRPFFWLTRWETKFVCDKYKLPIYRDTSNTVSLPHTTELAKVRTRGSFRCALRKRKLNTNYRNIFRYLIIPFMEYVYNSGIQRNTATSLCDTSGVYYDYGRYIPEAEGKRCVQKEITHFSTLSSYDYQYYMKILRSITKLHLYPSYSYVVQLLIRKLLLNEYRYL